MRSGSPISRRSPCVRCSRWDSNPKLGSTLARLILEIRGIPPLLSGRRLSSLKRDHVSCCHFVATERSDDEWVETPSHGFPGDSRSELRRRPQGLPRTRIDSTVARNVCAVASEVHHSETHLRAMPMRLLSFSGAVRQSFRKDFSLAAEARRRPARAAEVARCRRRPGTAGGGVPSAAVRYRSRSRSPADASRMGGRSQWSHR